MKDLTTILNGPMTFWPTTLSAVLAAVLAVFFVFLFRRFWRQVDHYFWAFLAVIGSLKGFRWFAVKAYRNSVQNTFGKVTNVFLGRVEVLDLEKIFVPLTLHQRGQNDSTHKQNTRETLTSNEHGRLMILGDPGSGKSTLLKTLATGISKKQWHELRQYIPVFVSLRAFSLQSLPLVQFLIQTVMPEHRFRNPESTLKKLLAEGKILLLCDGLDEVNDEQLTDVLNRVFSFLEQWDTNGENRILITCREQNYDLLDDNQIFHRESFKVYRLSDMRNSELENIVNYRQEDFDKRNKDPGRFLKAIYESPDITALYRNPLLLTLGISLYIERFEEKIPQNLEAFYDETIDHMLRRHDFRDQKNLSTINRFETKEKMKFLKRFALSNMHRSTASHRDFEEFSIADMVEDAKAMAHESLNIEDCDAKSFVREIQKRAGLIKQLGQSAKYVYSHRSLHEFCAAKALAQSGEEGFRQVWPHIQNPRWRQTIIFYCSIEHEWAEKLIKAMVEDIKSIQSTDAKLTVMSLCGYCTAKLASPFESLRGKVIYLLSHSIENAPESTRLPLLVCLITLGRNAPARIKLLVEQQLRNLVSLENPQQLAKELVRLEKSAAISLLEFMANDDDIERQQSVLVGLNEIECVEKIDLLWLLLEKFTKRNDDINSDFARRQLLDTLGSETGAMQRLNNMNSHFDDYFDESEIRTVYPFIAAKSKPSNISKLLTLEAKTNTNEIQSTNWLEQQRPWRSFLKAVTAPKNDIQKKAWNDLPRDRNRIILSIENVWLRYVSWAIIGIIPIIICSILYSISNSNLKLSTVAIILLLGFVFSALPLTFISLLTSKIKSVKELNPSTLLIWPYDSPGTLKGKLKGIVIAISSTAFLSFIWMVISGLGLSYLPVVNPVYSPQGTVILIDTPTSTRLWDVIERKELPSIWHSRWNVETPVNNAIFSPDSERILVRLSDGSVSIFDIKTGRALMNFKNKNGFKATCFAFSPDGKKIVVGLTVGIVQVWDVNSKKSLLTLGIGSGAVTADITDVTFSPDGNKILAGSTANIARLWDALSGKQLFAKETNKEYSPSTIFSPDGSKFLTTSKDRTFNVWNVDTGDEQFSITQANSISFSPDSQRLITIGTTGIVQIRNATTGIELSQLGEDERQQIKAIYSPDQQKILTITGDNKVNVWNAKTLVNTMKFGRDVTDIAFSQDSQKILIVSFDKRVELWDTGNGELLMTIMEYNNMNIVILVLSLVLSILVSTVVYAILIIVPCFRFFDVGRKLYLRKPNHYLPLYDLQGIEKWLPPEHLNLEKNNKWDR